MLSREKHLRGDGRPERAALEILQPGEHLHLFSRRSIRAVLRPARGPHITFEPALFARYDMFPVVSRVALTGRACADAGSALAATPAARMIQALLDERTAAETVKGRMREEVDVLHGQVAAVDADRAARLAIIEEQGRRLGEVEAERNIPTGRGRCAPRPPRGDRSDRAARLAIIEEQGRRPRRG